MNLNKEPIKNWFGFTRRERRSAFIMLLLILLIIGIRYTVPDSRIEIEDITGTVPASESHSDLSRYEGTSGINPSFSHTRVAVIISQRSTAKMTIPQKSRIDINKGDSATLVRLPGIGPVLSVRIIKYRRLLGGFATIEQLKEVYGLPDETFEMIKERVFADSTAITKININSAGYKELSRFPYFEKYEITAILKYRELKGRIFGINDLTENKLIAAEKADKLRPYLKYEE